ncbi:MAG: hypothetical protein ACOCRB_00565 [Halanaerobiaceae bacterium]
MINDDNIDLNLILSFTNHYENLYEEGKITETQLNQVLNLLDNFEDYSPDEFKDKMIEIFGDIDS